MAIEPANDTVTFKGDSGQQKAADGVVIMGGAVSTTQSPLPDGVDRSGSIAANNAAVDLAPANPARKSLKGQNISNADLWINEFGGTAVADTAGSYKVAAGMPFSIGTNKKVSIVGATAGQKWTATES